MLRGTLAAAALACGLALSACTPPEVARHEETVSVTGVVRGIDVESRRIVIQGPERTIQYRVGEQVRNLEQVEVGDRVSLDYLESVAVAMADPDDTGEPLVNAIGARSAPGERPGGFGAMVGTVVVDFLGYDARTSTARIRTHDGTETTVNVAPSLRRFAETRSPGDRILILIEQAVAVSVTPVD